MTLTCRAVVVPLAVCAALAPHVPLTAQAGTRADWLALRASGFALQPGQSAEALLLEMNALLASPDPVLRDDVAFAAAEK